MRTIKSIKVDKYYNTRFGPAKVLKKEKGRITILLCDDGNEYSGLRATFWSHEFMEYLRDESGQATPAR